MKTIKIIMWIIWGVFSILAILFVISWLLGSGFTMTLGYITMAATPVVATLTGIYLLINQILYNGRLF